MKDDKSQVEFEATLRNLRRAAEKHCDGRARVEDLAYWGCARNLLAAMLRDLREIRTRD